MKIKRVLFLTVLFLLALVFQVQALTTVQLSPSYFPEANRGRPIANGKIYVGMPDTDPEVVINQKTLSVLQEDGSIIAVSQPIYTSAGGIPVYSGSPVTLLVDGNYSLKVLNSYDVQVYYIPSVDLNQNSNYYPDHNAADQGVTGDSNTVKYYIDTISTDSGTIFFRHNSGGATTTYTFSTNETIPSNINVIIEKGAILSIGAGITLTINGSFDAGLYQVFSGGGSVVGLKTDCSEWFGGSADGALTEDTTEFQFGINSLISGGSLSLSPTNSTNYYNIGAVDLSLPITINGPSEIHLTGVNAGFEFATAITGFSLKDIKLIGDGVTGNAHKAFHNNTSHDISEGFFSNLIIEDMIQGIDIHGLTYGRIIGNVIKDSQGEGPGTGYGIVAGSCEKDVFIGNIFKGNQRHSLYLNNSKFNVASGNIFYEHRNGLASGGTLGAITLSGEAEANILIGQLFANNVGPDIQTGANAGQASTLKAGLITGSMFYKSDSVSIRIGSTTASDTVNSEGISVINNMFYPSLAREGGIIHVYSGQVVDISSNTWKAKNASAVSWVAINLGIGTNADTYFGNISICNNNGIFTRTGGNGIFVNISDNLCTGTTEINIFNNRIETDKLIVYGTNPPTNPNIKTDWDFLRPVTLSVGAQTMNIAGYNRFQINGNAGASNITQFDNPYNGKSIELLFLDGNTTVTRSGDVRLAGGVDFVGSARDVLNLKYYDTHWHEVSRSVNN